MDDGVTARAARPMTTISSWLPCAGLSTSWCLTMASVSQRRVLFACTWLRQVAGSQGVNAAQHRVLSDTPCRDLRLHGCLMLGHWFEKRPDQIPAQMDRRCRPWSACPGCGESSCVSVRSWRWNGASLLKCVQSTLEVDPASASRMPSAVNRYFREPLFCSQQPARSRSNGVCRLSSAATLEKRLSPWRSMKLLMAARI